MVKRQPLKWVRGCSASLLLLMGALALGSARAQSVAPPPLRCKQPTDGAQIVPTRTVDAIKPHPGARTLANPLRINPAGRLTILVLGDSAIWGNGLKNSFKYADKVAQDVADGTGRTVRIVSYAHSGANLFNEVDSDYEPIRDSDKGVPPGDLNAGLPTTLQQEACAAEDADYQQAEIVLVDGCINDVGAEKIALPFPLSGLSVSQVEQRTHQWCSDGMVSLLRNLKQDFRYATVVVSNYWLIVSDKSNPIGIAIQKGAQPGANSQQRQLYESMKNLMDTEMKAERETGEMVTDAKLAAAPQELFRHWGDNSNAFLSTSQHCFEWAVALVDGKTSAPNGADACPSVAAVPAQPATADVHVFLAIVDANPLFSYGAKHKRIWSVPIRFIREDQEYGERLQLCETHYHTSEAGAAFVCTVNPTAHPNVAGAEAFRTSISTILKTAWGGHGS